MQPNFCLEHASNWVRKAIFPALPLLATGNPSCPASCPTSCSASCPSSVPFPALPLLATANPVSCPAFCNAFCPTSCPAFSPVSCPASCPASCRLLTPPLEGMHKARHLYNILDTSIIAFFAFPPISETLLFLLLLLLVSDDAVSCQVVWRRSRRIPRAVSDRQSSFLRSGKTFPTEKETSLDGIL